MDRPGAVFQGFLPDGREVCVYPLLFGAGKITLGPADCPVGFDTYYEYDDLQAAIEAAHIWVGMTVDSTPHPEGFNRLVLPGGSEKFKNERTT